MFEVDDKLSVFFIYFISLSSAFVLYRASIFPIYNNGLLEPVSILISFQFGIHLGEAVFISSKRGYSFCSIFIHILR